MLADKNLSSWVHAMTFNDDDDDDDDKDDNENVSLLVTQKLSAYTQKTINVNKILQVIKNS